MRVDVCFYMHKEAPFFAENLRALKENTRYPHNFFIVCEPGSAHDNIQRCLDRSTADRIVILDDDCRVLPSDPDWLSRMMNLFDTHERCAVAVPVECKTQDALDRYLADPETTIRNSFPCYPIPICFNWLPGYCMGIDRTRVPQIYADRSIPRPTGMSDLDMSLQAATLGWDCMAITEFAVYHPWKSKGEEEERMAGQYTQELNAWAWRKWGAYLNTMDRQPYMIVR